MQARRLILPSVTLVFILGLLLMPKHPAGPRAMAPGALPLNQQLMQACWLHCIHTARLRLAQGADPNVQDTQHLTPLIVASIEGQPELVRSLLAYGADASAQSRVPLETTALEAACYHRENDVGRISAVPNDPGGESMRGQPIDRDEALKDDRYAEVIQLLKQAVREQQH